MPLESASGHGGRSARLPAAPEGQGSEAAGLERALDVGVKNANESYAISPAVGGDQTAVLENKGEANGSSPHGQRGRRKRFVVGASLAMAAVVAVLLSVILGTVKRTGDAGLPPKQKPAGELIPAWTPARQPQTPRKRERISEVERQKSAGQPESTVQPTPIVLPTYVDELLPGAMPIRLDAESMLQYSEELRKAGAQMEEAWNSATESVREAFVKNFLPTSSSGGAGQELPPNPLAYIEAFAPVLPSSSSDVWAPTDVARYNHAVNTLFSTTVIRAATSRLLFLGELERYCNRSGMGSRLLERKKLTLPSKEELAQATDTVDFDEFISMLEGRRVIISEKHESAMNQKIPRVVAQKLAGEVVVDSLHVQNDRYVHGLFEEFMIALRTDDLVLTDGGGIPFPLKAFAIKLAVYGGLREVDVLSPKDIGNWAAEWTLEEQLDRLELLELAETEKLRDWTNVTTDFSYPALFTFALGLL